MEAVLDEPDQLSGLKYECGICLKDFTSSLYLQTHIETHKHDTHSCPQCGMTFPGFPELDDHLTSFHAEANVAELASTYKDTKVPVEDLDEGLSLTAMNPHSGDSIWSIDPRDLPTEGNSLKVNLGEYPSDCNESSDRNESDHQQKKSLKFSCRICHLYFETRNHLLRHLKLTNNLVSKEDHLTIDAEANKKSPGLIQRNKGGMKSLNESNKTSLRSDKPRCRVCKVELPQCKKLRRAHIRKHLLVKLNKRVYHVWKYLKTSKKEGLKSDVKKTNFLESFKKPSIDKYDAFEVTPPVSDEDKGGNKHRSDISNYQPRVLDGQDTGLRKGKQPNILLRCFLCGDKFTTKTGLENHFQIVHSCRKSLKEVKPLPHNKMSSWFTCSACGKKVHGKEKFKNHLTEHSFRHDLLKQKCNSDFAAVKSTSPNKGSKHFSKGPWFTCTECGKLCKGKKLLQDHAKKFHRVYGNENEDQTPSKSSSWRRCCKKPSCAWYVCNACSERFKGKARINSHIVTCSSVINEADVNLKPHRAPIDIGRGVPLPISTLPHCSWFACELCNVKVHGRKRMVQHYEVCQGVENTISNRQRSLDTHVNLELKPAAIQVTPGSKHDTTFNHQFTKYKCGPWFRCLACNKLIKGKSNLKSHQHSTRTEKQKLLQTDNFDQTLSFTSQSGVNFSVWWCWYSCQICGLKIRGKKNANLHRHSEEMLNSSRNMKPQGNLQMTGSSSSHISQADAVANYDSDITSEEKTAMGKEFPLPKFLQHGVWYRCQTCSVAVRGKKAMWSHRHGTSVKDENNLTDSAAMLNNNWTCSLCTKCFASKKSLLLHMKNHTDCQEYKCCHCNKVFLTKSGFKLHQHIYGKEHSLVAPDKSTEERLLSHQKINADDMFFVNDEPLGDNRPEQTPRQEADGPEDWTNVMEFQGKKVGETSSDLPPLDFYGKLDNNDGRKTKESEKCSIQEARDHTLSANPSRPDIENKVDSAVFENGRINAESKNNRDGDKSDLQCTTCGFTASSAASLKRHQTNKHTFSPVTARSIKKNINQYVSSDGQVYQCDICAKQFALKKVVKEHVRQHIVKQYMSGHRGSGATQNSFSDSRMVNDDERGVSEDEVMLIEETPNKYQGSKSCIPSISEVGSVDGQTFFELSENEGRTEHSQNREVKKSTSVVKRMTSKGRKDEGSFNFTSDHFFEAEENSFRGTGEQGMKIVESSKAKARRDIPPLVKLEFFCQVCFKSFATNMMASEHVLSHYAENSEMKSQGPSPTCQLVCEVCGQTFRSTKELRNHEENHSQEEIHNAQIKCLECNLSFKNKQLLTKHLSLHDYVYLKCPQCCSFFIDHAFLNLHILRKRHFLCDCGQLFLTFQALDQHRNIVHC